MVSAHTGGRVGRVAPGMGGPLEEMLWAGCEPLFTRLPVPHPQKSPTDAGLYFKCYEL